MSLISRLASLISLFIFLSSFCYAQKKITGVVTDSATASPVPFASIGLLKLPENTILKGTLSDENGKFKIDQVQAGTYILKISAVGYMEKTSESVVIDSSSDNIDLQVKLSTSSSTLNEVAVTAIRRTIEFKNNNITLNVEDSPLAKGNSVFDLLSKLPGVSIENDQIQIQGKTGVIVMIDDRPQTISGQQLANLLKGMTADMVKKVELLKNPPVKYDASGTSGMINIVTKKTNIYGFTGTLFSSYGQGMYSDKMIGGSLNYKSKRLTFYSNLSATQNNFREVETFKKQFGENDAFSFLTGENTLKHHYQGLNGKVGLDWNLSPASVLGVKVETDPGVYTFHSRGKNTLSGDEHANFNYLGASNYLYDEWIQTNLNVDFNHKLDTLGSSFSIITDYTFIPEYVSNDTRNGFFDVDGNQVLSSNNFNNNDRSNSDMFSAKINLTKNIDTSSSFETGLKFSQIKTFNDFFFERDVANNGVYVEDKSLSNKFHYRELAYAGYFNYSKSFKKLSMQLGARIENLYLKGSSDKQFALNRKYLNIFPNISVDYKRNENHDFQLNINRRINRPGFFELNPMRQYHDQYYYSQGNPGLIPDYSNKAELSYNYKNSFSTSFAYSYIENIKLGYTEQVDSAMLTIESQKNMDYCSSFEYTLFYRKTVIKNWDISINASAQYSKFKGDIAGVKFEREGFGSFANLNNTILVGKRLKLEAGARFFGPNVYGIVERGINWSAQVALKMTMLNEKLDLTVGMDDVFHSMKWKTQAHFDTQNWSYARRGDTMRFKVAWNYKFGKIKIEERRRGDEDDKSRLSH
jgi:outer membrane receptor protein involved in Fe transport